MPNLPVPQAEAESLALARRFEAKLAPKLETLPAMGQQLLERLRDYWGAAGRQTSFNPTGTGYDYAQALLGGGFPDSNYASPTYLHLPSRNPITGQLLKGAGHPTFWMGLQGERDAGYDVSVGPDGKFYSTKKAGR